MTSPLEARQHHALPGRPGGLGLVEHASGVLEGRAEANGQVEGLGTPPVVGVAGGQSVEGAGGGTATPERAA